MREIVVGTGGDDLYTFDYDEPNSETRYSSPTFGVLSLALHPRSYDWRFHPLTGQYSDSGTGAACYDRPPAAAFGSSPATPAAGSAVAFDASASSDPDGTVAGYRWDFGDGSGSTARAPVHVYGTPGTFVVRLTVTDDGGNSATTSRSLTIDPVTASLLPPTPPAHPTPAPTAAFTVVPRAPLASRAASFDASASAGAVAIERYSWSFGDGSSASGRTVTHAYRRAGTYTASLPVVDSGGGAATATRTVAVSPLPPHAHVRVVRRSLGRVRQRGLALRVRSDVPASARLLVEIGRARARRLGFEDADNQLVVGSRSVRLRAARTATATVPLTREARLRLAGQSKTVLVLVARFRTGAGGQTVVRRTVALHG